MAREPSRRPTKLSRDVLARVVAAKNPSLDAHSKLEARVRELEQSQSRLSFIDLGDKIVCMFGEDPLFTAPKAAKDEIAFLYTMQEEETKEALSEAIAWLENKRNGGGRK